MSDSRSARISASAPRQDEQKKSSKNEWNKLLENAMASKLDRPGYILLVGSPSSGKKALISAMGKVVKHNEPDYSFKIVEGAYLVDYKYINGTRLKDDENEELGKLNLFIVSKHNELISDFLTREMLSNFLVIINLDMTKPEKLAEEFNDHYAFAERVILKQLEDCDEELNLKIRKGLKEINARIRKFTGKELVHKATTEAKPAESSPPKAAAQAATPPPAASAQNPPADHAAPEKKEENLDELEDPAKKQREEVKRILAEPIDIPLVLVASRGEYLESIHEEAMLDHIVHTLRNLAISKKGSLALTSTSQNVNIESLIYLLYAALCDKSPENPKVLSTNTAINKLFYPLGADSKEKLSTDYPKDPEYTFKPKTNLNEKGEKKGVVDIKLVQDFLIDLSRNKFEYSTDEEMTRSEIKGTSMPSIRDNLNKILKPTSGADRLRGIDGKVSISGISPGQPQ